MSPEMLQRPLLALGISDAAMFGWLAAAALPLLIHLWSRRRHRETPWAAATYLAAAFRRRRWRLFLEQGGLLAARCAILVFVAVAAARPYLDAASPAAAARERLHHVLVLDGSYSMSYRTGEKSAFQRAQQVAGQVVAEAVSGDGFSLVLMASPPRVVIGDVSFDLAAVRQEIESLAPTPTTIDLPATIAEVQHLLDRAQAEHPRVTRTEVVLLSDLRRAGWPLDSPAAAKALARQAQAIAESAALRVIDVGSADHENRAIVAVQTPPVVLVGEHAELKAQIHNDGPVPQAGVSVELLIDGRSVQQQTVDLPAALTRTVSFKQQFSDAGWHGLEIRLPPDRLPEDDRRFHALEVRERLQVLLIDGKPSSRPLGGAADYLAAALQPKRGKESGWRIHCEVRAESALLEQSLSNFQAIYLCNVGHVAAAEALALDRYLQSGGNVVFFLGGQVDASRYQSALLSPGPEGTRILPARLGEVVSRGTERLDPLDYRHPVLSVFRGRLGASLLDMPVFRHFRLQPVDRARARTVLALAGGDPLIVEEPILQGRVVVVATAADLSWSAMPLCTSFLPLMQELLTYLVGESGVKHQQTVGESFQGSLALAPGSPPFLQRPDGQRQSLAIEKQGAQGRWHIDRTSQVGIYRVSVGDDPRAAQAFAVNVNPGEGDLRRLDPSILRNEMWPGVEFTLQTDWTSDPALPVNTAPRGPLAAIFLAAALSLAVFETIWAWRAGRVEP